MRKILVLVLLTKVLFGDDGWIEIASLDLPTEKIEKKALSKDFFKGYPTISIPLEPIHADPIWAFYSEEEMVEMELKDSKMVTP